MSSSDDELSFGQIALFVISPLVMVVKGTLAAHFLVQKKNVRVVTEKV